MSTVQIDVWQLVSTLSVVLGAFFSAVWLMSKALLKQIDKRLEGRFTAQQTDLDDVKKKYEKLDSEVRRILIELPREYVARSDYVRRETVIEAKIDQLALRIQNWILERANHA